MGGVSANTEAADDSEEDVVMKMKMMMCEEQTGCEDLCWCKV